MAYSYPYPYTSPLLLPFSSAFFPTAHTTAYATVPSSIQGTRLTLLDARTRWENRWLRSQLHHILSNPGQTDSPIHKSEGNRLLEALSTAQRTGTDMIFPPPGPLETHFQSRARVPLGILTNVVVLAEARKDEQIPVVGANSGSKNTNETDTTPRIAMHEIVGNRLLKALTTAQRTGNDMVFPPPGPVEARFQSCANVVAPTEAENHEEKAEAEAVVGTCGGSSDMNELYMSVVPGPATDESRAPSRQALADELLAPGMKQRLDKLEEDPAERVKVMEAMKAGNAYDYIFSLLEETSLASDTETESEYSWTACSDSTSELFVVWGQENATGDSDVDVLDKAGRNQWDHLVIEEGALAGPQTSDSAQEMRNEYCETLEDILDLLRAVDAVRVGEMREKKRALLAFVVFRPNSVINHHHVFSGRKLERRSPMTAWRLRLLFHTHREPPLTFDDTRGTSWVIRQLPRLQLHPTTAPQLHRCQYSSVTGAGTDGDTLWELHAERHPPVSASVRDKLWTNSRSGAALGLDGLYIYSRLSPEPPPRIPYSGVHSLHNLSRVFFDHFLPRMKKGFSKDLKLQKPQSTP
ncbi:hypothetical protein FB45DRAFT_1001698 [Roridomyces roridus]|uniref:Uncharacterized protein n=1 Tax=Roridomyces roridus TaxID=1738132 RepID=A0AAD7C1N5_9AGAR|nr:hypothetical protein FB45DRAFT_1001698 [Roridomyces roridus]